MHDNALANLWVEHAVVKSNHEDSIVNYSVVKCRYQNIVQTLFDCRMILNFTCDILPVTLSWDYNYQVKQYLGDSAIYSSAV